ncbi:MAG: NAD-dependent succinate-semialdehyde dehydrogenase [Waddliaceae bacterium]
MDLNQFFDQPVLASFINGKCQLTSDNPREPLISQVKKTAWREIIPATKNDVENAITSAACGWSVSAQMRSLVLQKIAHMLLEHQSLFAKIMAHEMGKTILEGEGEIQYSADYFNWFAGEAKRVYGTIIPSQFSNKRLSIQYEPIGVCGMITPWNFPVAMGARKVAAALAAGCTVVVKPSTETPISMLLLAHIAKLCGVPDGVFNVIVGDPKEIGEAFLRSPLVKKISFTGSTEVGKRLYRESAETMKRLTLELGGHAPLLVFEDADLDHALQQSIQAKFRNNGQTCICPNRFLIHHSLYPSFVQKFKDAVSKLKIGSPLDPENDLSNILHPTAAEKVERHLKDAKEKGAEVFHFGKQPYHPAVVCGVTPDMLLWREETFGPVASITSCSSHEEMIALANDTLYGLAAYLFTQDITRAQQAAEALDYGIIGINDGLPSTHQASFGGRKQSGFGREGGPTGIYEYLQEKYISELFP